MVNFNPWGRRQFGKRPMSIAGKSFLSVAGALGRKLRNFGAVPGPVDSQLPTSALRVNRDELVGLFDWQEGAPIHRLQDLRMSERLERQTMMMIREAIYRSDPRL